MPSAVRCQVQREVVSFCLHVCLVRGFWQDFPVTKERSFFVGRGGKVARGEIFPPPPQRAFNFGFLYAEGWDLGVRQGSWVEFDSRSKLTHAFELNHSKRTQQSYAFACTCVYICTYTCMYLICPFIYLYYACI